MRETPTEKALRELFYGHQLGAAISFEDFMSKVKEAMTQGVVLIHNDGMEAEHKHYFLDGEPAMHLGCMCSNCLDYFANE